MDLVSDSDDEYWLDAATVDVKEQREAWTVNLDFYGKKVNFKVDTGADVTVLRECDYKEFVNPPNLKPSKSCLRSPGGRVDTVGEFIAETTRKKVTYRFRVVVVPNTAGTNLLGRAVSEKMGLVKRLEDIDSRVFGSTGLLKTQPVKLILKEGSKPYSVSTARRVPFPIQKQVKEQLDKMERDGVIKKVTEATDYCAPIVPVRKKGGKIRICVDYKKLNKNIKRPHLMLPNLEDIAPQLKNSKVFTTLDVSSGFWQVPLDKDSAHLTTFITSFGRYCFLRLPMGINVGPEEFQRKMSETMNGLRGCEVIMDDILIHGETQKEHDERLSQALKRIEASGLKLNRDKCHFSKSEVAFFGHRISSDGIRPDPGKVDAITKLEPPKNVTELKRVIGMINYLGRFTKDLSTTMKPMTDLLRKDVQWRWDSAQREAFEKVKLIIVNLPSLLFYSVDRQTVVSADASSFGLGAVLLQQNDSGDLEPIAFASRTMTPAEQRYSQIEKECLASVWACEKFYKYLVGLESFQLLTDHKPLVPLMSTKDLDQAPPRCLRLLLRMARFNAEVRHVPGKQLVIADCLSRSPLAYTESDVDRADDVDDYIDFVQSSWRIRDHRLQSLKAATEADDDLQAVIKYCHEGWPNQIPSSLKPYHKVKDDLSVVNGLVVFRDRVVIPVSQRQEVKNKLHESHQGIEKCLEFAKLTVFWPGLRAELTQLVENCSTCRENRPAQRHEPLRPTELPSRPWSQIGADFASFRNKDYLVVTDYYSRWIEIKQVTSLSSSAVIPRFKQIFSTHGIPDILVSDNGSPFSSRDFAVFAREYGFDHHTSSPHFPQANGQAESGVKTAKKILAQTEPDVALMMYRSTPHSATGLSPSVMLIGRQLKTKVPVLPSRLQPVQHNDKDIRLADSHTKQDYKKYYDERHGVRPLPQLQPNDTVLMKTDNEKGKWKDFGQVLSPADASGRSYFIQSPRGVLRRNRKNMQKVPQTIYTIPPDPETDLPEETETQEQETLTGTENPTPQPPVQNVSRYGRILKQPARYIEEH